MDLTSKIFIVHLMWLCLGDDAAHNIPPFITVHSWETADLIYHRTSNESMESFRAYRVRKNGVPFSYIERGSNRSNCTDDVLMEFCLSRTEFKKVNASHLLLRIRKTEVNDTGKYSVHHVFKSLTRDTSEGIMLKVTADLRVYENSTTEIPPSVKRPDDEHNKSSDSHTTTPPAATSAGMTTLTGHVASAMLCLLIAVMSMQTV